jgi:hypothetical protein
LLSFEDLCTGLNFLYGKMGILLLIGVMKILVPRLRCKKEAEKRKEGLKLAVWGGGGGDGWYCGDG